MNPFDPGWFIAGIFYGIAACLLFDIVRLLINDRKQSKRTTDATKEDVRA